MSTAPRARWCGVLAGLVLGAGALGAGALVGRDGLAVVAPARAQPAATDPRAAPTPAPPRAQPPRAKASRAATSRPRARRATPVRQTAPRRVAPVPAPRPVPPAPRVAPRTAPCQCPSRSPRGPRRSGVTLQLSLGTSAQVYASTLTTAAYPGMSGRFQLGYRYRRVTVGLGLEFVRTRSKDAAGEEREANLVLFRPTLEVALWQPKPLSLYLTLGVHGGFLGTAGRNVVDDELPAVGFHGGLGVRYFFHPRFSLGLEGGFQGVWLVDDDGDDTVDGTMMFYGAVVLLAIL